MDPIIDFLGFNIVLEYDNDLLTIPSWNFQLLIFDEFLMNFGTEKIILETYLKQNSAKKHDF